MSSLNPFDGVETVDRSHWSVLEQSTYALASDTDNVDDISGDADDAAQAD